MLSNESERLARAVEHACEARLVILARYLLGNVAFHDERRKEFPSHESFSARVWNLWCWWVFVTSFSQWTGQLVQQSTRSSPTMPRSFIACVLLLASSHATSASSHTNYAHQYDHELFVGSLANESILSFDLTADGFISGGRRTTPNEVKRSWQTLHPNGKTLYSADGGPGEISAWNLTPDDGLQQIGNAVDVGANPVFVTAVKVPSTASKGTAPKRDSQADDDHVVVIAADYTAGAIVVVQTDARTGALGEVAVTRHTEHPLCPNPIGDRQASSHPHGVFTSPTHPSHVFAPDLGLDRIYHYTIDSNGTLQPFSSQPFVVAPLCSGPRHIAFDDSGKFMFVVHELSNTLTVWRLDDVTHELTWVGDHVSTLPPDSGWSYCSATAAWDAPYTNNCTKAAEVRFARLQSFTVVYVSNRGHDSVSMFHVDEKTGQLTRPSDPAAATVLGLHWPRSFSVIPDTTPSLLVVAVRECVSVACVCA